MSIYGSPRIVASGLVLCLDAGNPSSYPGAGTTWRDLSSNSKHAVLYNSPTWSNAAGLGNFSGFTSNQYIQVENSPYTVLPTGTSNRTLVCGFRTPSTFSPSLYMTIFMYGSAATDQSWGCVLSPSTLTTAVVATHTWAGCVIGGTTALTTSTDYIASVHYNHTSTPRHRIMVNGISQSIEYGQGKSSDYSLNTGTGYLPVFGTRIAGPTEQLLAGGMIYFLHVYNRDLTDEEARQTFQTLSGRLRI